MQEANKTINEKLAQGPWIVGKKFSVQKRLGHGSFGLIYTGENVETQELVAIKFENLKCKYPQLLYEARLYKNLYSDKCNLVKFVNNN